MTLSAMQAVSYTQFPVSELNTSISAIRFAYSTSRTICCFAKNLFEQSRKLWLFNGVSLWQRYYIAVFCIRYLEGNFITFISSRGIFTTARRRTRRLYAGSTRRFRGARETPSYSAATRSDILPPGFIRRRESATTRADGVLSGRAATAYTR